MNKHERGSQTSIQDLEDLSTKEVEKRYQLRENLFQGENSPYKFDPLPKNKVQEILKNCSHLSSEELENQKEKKESLYSVAGRVKFLRSFGKSAFIHLRDETGVLQLFISKNLVDEKSFLVFKNLHVGDIIYAKGKPFRTQTGHLSLKLQELILLTKSLRPLPEKFHGLTSVETRYRQRYLDFIMNSDVLETFKIRFSVIQNLREWFLKENFLEVETPMLHPVQGGTIARPFTTFHNTLSIPLFLRIAPELYLKRLIVGGFEKVFEMNRNFRNEGVSTKHNPEFTMLEFYEAYKTFEDLISFNERLFNDLSKKVLNKSQVHYQSEIIDFTPPWNRLTVEEAILKYTKFNKKDLLRDRKTLLEYGRENKIPMNPKETAGHFLMNIFDEEVEKHLIQPTFITHHPTAVSPLARKNDKDPFTVDRFEIYINGWEIANAFTELNDPLDQRERMEEQAKEKKAGNKEACDLDEDYIRALEYGLPPCAGEGIGVDRLVMLLSNAKSIRDVILFPLLKPTE